MHSGDSYTSTGFNASLEAPSIQNPMGNPALGHYLTRTGEKTATDGINWLGHTVTEFNQSSILSYKFAAYGATVDNSIIPAVPKDLHYCKENAVWITTSSIFGIWVGINDVYISPEFDDSLAKISSTIQSYTSLLNDLYLCGARRFFVMNVPPISRTPAMLSNPVQHQVAVDQGTLNFNFQLELMVALWSNHHTKVSITINLDP
ncbi:uncharacterized protein N7483_007443 [Penicillium malachiteum]|uniref:uncharacterized protein n=1 Tax=Penicillium malachiteum TaxID=1324776 RepID=UPI002548FF63|nr:uncharacterized protein N7483_007443 [Penicillium malachiteum]KAJ5726086.1 hypothetical protein N7483_007443 [Penicillium malachiteum]